MWAGGTVAWAVSVGEVAEAPLLSAGAVSVSESTAAALTIPLTIGDTSFDSDDTLDTVTIAGVPAGWNLTGDGASNVGGTWTAGAASLAALQLVSPAAQDATAFTLLFL